MNYRVRYARTGRGTNEVLLIHGLGGSALSWTYNLRELSKHFQVFAPDLIGFGKSDRPKIRYDMKMFLKFVKRFMDRVGIKKANIVGSSMGGQIAAEFALSYPSRVQKLVLVSPAGIPPREFKGTGELKRYAKILDAKSFDETRKALTPVDSSGISITDDYVSSVYDYVRSPGVKHAFLSSLQGSAKAPRLASRLKSIKVKTLVVWGKNDNLIPVKYCEPFISRADNFRLLLIERCGHRPHAERPDIFNSAVIDFLKEN